MTACVMMTLRQLWTFMSLLSAVSGLITLYPSLGGSETLSCECVDHQCQKVFWYRLRWDREEMQFLVFCNSANIVNHADGINSTRFKASTSSLGSRITYTLRISDLQAEDAGRYSCMFELQRYGQNSSRTAVYQLRPGEPKPTSPPLTVKTFDRAKKKPYACKSNNQSGKGCKPLVLWPSVGVLLVLAVVLISTLYYFSRLPKKCQHQFVKKMQLK